MAMYYNIRLNLKWDEGNQTYNVTSPDVPELFTFGSDLTEIRHNVQEAIELLLDVLDERGEERPEVLQIPVDWPVIELTLPIGVSA